MRLTDPEQLEQVGLTLYERKALMALMLCGVADAATLCREGGVPSSKIYLAMEKLAGLGLVQVQPTRPKMFAALPSEVVVGRIIEIARERSERFVAQASGLQATRRRCRIRMCVFMWSLSLRAAERGILMGATYHQHRAEIRVNCHLRRRHCLLKWNQRSHEALPLFSSRASRGEPTTGRCRTLDRRAAR